ncbi:hypothetical protein EMIHUDRAFT_204371 [Emiliania huxleyi CCMP1516]|uniref:Uncharacterized protein n=2 Tax=Emiliania huxleyi TaxID=2903 RepID=A0A0D3JY98_EMIH1|nr:hypothetical protein EMIHUDRAFT_204371 [Emiliania huxleyi CCMP1516]EOD28483.1 hypothetical protein EMIHUDRAFT_204371 [Emiliania huxleyi CCMP1516]|eukprot:XP_005780912.1 hypothetical protein EMIHUDRAFT_204371 [Emiliania huxleyi CCMP1516]
MSEAADAVMIEAAEADARWAAARRPQDDPLTDRPVDAAAAAERERSAKAAKLAAQTANAMVAAGAPVKASSMMVERVFAARLDGPDKFLVARRKERKTAAGAGTAVEVVAGLEKMANTAVRMVGRDGAEGITGCVKSCLSSRRRWGDGSWDNGGNVASVGHLYGFGNTLDKALTAVVGCKERGRQVDGPLDHSTVWVKKAITRLVLVETLGCIAPPTKQFLHVFATNTKQR